MSDVWRGLLCNNILRGDVRGYGGSDKVGVFGTYAPHVIQFV